MKKTRGRVISALVGLGVGCLFAVSVPVFGQDTLSTQVLRLLDRVNTWTVAQTFGDITVTGTCTGCGGGSGAPTDAQYWTGAANATLSAEKNLGALSTGLVINTAGVPSAYSGSACSSGQYTASVSATGVVTCSTPAGTGGLNLIEQHAAATSASLDFTSCISLTYDDYVIKVLNLIPATDAVSLLMRMSTNAGVSYDSGANYWSDASAWRAGLAATAAGGGSGTGINFGTNTQTVDNGTTRGAWFSLELINPSSTTLYKQVSGRGGVIYSDGTTRVMLDAGGEYTSTTAVNAFQFLFSSGNIVSGTVRCYGVAKSDGSVILVFLLVRRRRTQGSPTVAWRQAA